MDSSSSAPKTVRTASVRRDVIGRFHVDEVIGRGGMGEVLKARDPENGQVVALKVLDIESYEDDELRKRFEREAESARSLDHRNIAHIYGMELDEDSRPVLVMEYIEGIPLDTLIHDHAEMAFSQVTDMVIQAARGLEYAYRRSIIHRDIKPGNLIVTSDGTLKIIDFGLAKSLWDNSSLTAAGMVVGTPRYISPEQGMGRSVDHRSDIYSLGATFYELVTHQTPFDGDTPLAIMMKHINSPLVPPYLVNPTIPADVSDIIVRMLAKDPRERYQDYEPLIRDLESAKIHRLAKERRTGAQDLSAASTMVLPAGYGNGDDTAEKMDRPFVHQPSSYLSEGLVEVNFGAEEKESGSSPLKVIFLSLAGLVIVALATIFLLQPVSHDGEHRTSRLSAGLLKLIRREDGTPAPPRTAADLVKQDRDNIATTRSRMEAVVSRIIQMKLSDKISGVPTIRQLREQKVFSEDETRDAWDNDFYIVSHGPGGGTLVALGKDGQDGTSDDFSLSLNGQEFHAPPSITLQEARESLESDLKQKLDEAKRDAQGGK